MSASEKTSPVTWKWRLSTWFPDLDPIVMQKLDAYFAELKKFNGKLNLVSRRTELDSDLLHFADSLLAGRIVLGATKTVTIHDIGSGNGFPGLVLAALAPDRRFILIDKDSKKVEFLKHTITRMELKNAEAHCKKLDELAAGSVECAISRGFASVSGALLAARGPFMKNGDYFHMKGSNWVREVAEMPTQLCSIWSPRLISNYTLPGSTAVFSIVAAKKLI